MGVSLNGRKTPWFLGKPTILGSPPYGFGKFFLESIFSKIQGQRPSPEYEAQTSPEYVQLAIAPGYHHGDHQETNTQMSKAKKTGCLEYLFETGCYLGIIINQYKDPY